MHSGRHRKPNLLDDGRRRLLPRQRWLLPRRRGRPLRIKHATDGSSSLRIDGMGTFSLLANGEGASSLRGNGMDASSCEQMLMAPSPCEQMLRAPPHCEAVAWTRPPCKQTSRVPPPWAATTRTPPPYVAYASIVLLCSSSQSSLGKFIHKFSTVNNTYILSPFSTVNNTIDAILLNCSAQMLLEFCVNIALIFLC